MGSYTVVGNLGGDVQLREDPGGTWCTFSVCETKRVFDRQTGQWRDGPQSWWDVKVSGALAVHAEKSLRKGHRVVVHGDVAERHWTAQDGTPRSRFQLTADALGHDLRWGVTSFARWSTDDGFRERVNRSTGEVMDTRWDAVPGQGQAPAEESAGGDQVPRADLPAFDSRSLVDYGAGSGGVDGIDVVDDELVDEEFEHSA